MADSPGSPLSSHASSEFTEDAKLDEQASIDVEQMDEAVEAMPPTKRRRLGSAYHGPRGYLAEPLAGAGPDDDDISSDTSGEAPSSPPAGSAYVQEDDYLEQVTTCKWRNCTQGDCGTMDDLVAHIHEVHVKQRQKRYACEWEDCARIDASHASGYALRAHMRSHTREKPFFCALPECDKSFTRSDALAKHMRTVHETEALRPSDPVPRNHSQAQVKPQRLKLIVSAKPPEEKDDATIDGEASSILVQVPGQYPHDLGLDEDELAMPPDQLYKLCRRQVYWSEQDGKKLKEECDELETKYKKEWQSKELVMANLMEAELATAMQKGPSQVEEEKIMNMMNALLPEKMLPITAGQTPWYRVVHE